MGFFRSLVNLPAGGPLGVVPGLYHAATGRQVMGGSSPGAPAPGDNRDPSQLQWDPNTFMPTSGGPPSAQQAAAWDWESQRQYQQAKQRQFSDATGSYNQALSTLGGYRAGGAASAAAQILQNKGSLQFNIGNSYERPDVFANARQQAQDNALRAAKQAQRMQMLGGIIQAGATVAGAAIGGAPGAIAGNAVGQSLGAAAGANAGAQAGQQGPSSQLGPQGPGTSQGAQQGVIGPQPAQGFGAQQAPPVGAQAGQQAKGAQMAPQAMGPQPDPQVQAAAQTATTLMAADHIDWSFWAKRNAQLEAMVN